MLRRPLESTQPRQVDVQYLAIQEQQCRQCLVQHAGYDIPMHAKPGQEALDLRDAQRARMAFAMEPG